MKLSAAYPFIPQRPPMVMVDMLADCNAITTVTRFTVKSDTLFVQDDRLRASGLIENIAQTCAARIGFLNQDKPVQIGVVGGVRNFIAYQLPKVGDCLETTITLQSEFSSAIMFDAAIHCGNTLLASCSMKVFLFNSNEENE